MAQSSNFTKTGFCHLWFPVNFPKIFRKTFFKNTFIRLLDSHVIYSVQFIKNMNLIKPPPLMPWEISWDFQNSKSISSTEHPWATASVSPVKVTSISFYQLVFCKVKEKLFPIKWKQEAPQSWSHSGSFHKFFKTKTGHNQIKKFIKKTYSDFDSLGSAFPKMAFPVQKQKLWISSSNLTYINLPKYQISDSKDNFVFADQKVCLQCNRWVQHIRIFLGTTFQLHQVI